MENRTIWAARFVVLVSFLDLFIQFPVVAPYARSLGASASLVGIVVAAYSATNLVGNLIAGIILDRWGRKTPILGGLLMTAAALAAYAIARTPEQLLAARVVHGLATAVLTPGAFAIIGDTADPTRRARVMGASGAIIAVTAVVGPPLAGFTRDRLGVAAVFLGGALFMLLAAGVFGRLAHEPPEHRHTDRPRRSVAAYLALWAQPRLAVAYLAALALTVGLGTLVTHLPLALAARGEPASRIGLAFTIYAAVAMMGMAGPLSRLGDRYGRIGPVAGGLLIIGAGMVVLGILATPVGVAAGMAVFGLGFGLLFPSATALVADATGRANRGAAFGIFYAVYSLGVVIGSVLSGLLNDWLGDLTGAPFLAGAAIAIAVSPAILLIGRRAADPAPDHSGMIGPAFSRGVGKE
ncbi:MAG: MFS transporter [Chloroflexi bacterium]|nr:MFS transporter [Chloroflexota bacterium]